MGLYDECIDMHRVNLLLVVLFLALTVSFDSYSASKKFISIGTASISGVYYPVGAALCKMVNKISEDIQCSVQSTPGTIYNMNALRNNDIDIGIGQADCEYNAYNGCDIFAKNGPMSNLRTLFLIHSDVFTVIARKDSNIVNLNDIKGKKINIGSIGTGVRDTVNQLMKVKGWSVEDFKLASELKSSEQAQALCDNKIDVMIDVIGHPNGSVQEASATCDTVIIPIDEETTKELLERYPYYHRYVIPGGMYIGIDHDIDTFAVRTSVLSTAEADDEIIYQVVKASFQGFRRLKLLHPVLSDLTKQAMVGINSAPFHEGAIRYYKEVGLL